MKVDRTVFLRLLSVITGSLALAGVDGCTSAAPDVEVPTSVKVSAQPNDAGRSNDAGHPTDGMPEAEAPMTCGDTRTDKANCGTCGHDCRGGGCVAGKCQPVVFAAAQARVEQLIEDGDQLYWLSTSPADAISHCPTPDCYGGPRPLPGPMGESLMVAVADSTVFWTFSDTHAMGNAPTCPLYVTGPSGRSSPLVSTTGHCTAVPFTRGGSLYWVDLDFSSTTAPASGNYMTCTLPACADVRSIYKGAAAQFGEFTVDGTNIYFGYVQATVAQVPIWGVGACPLSGCDAPKALAITNTQPTSFATDGDHIVWTTSQVPISACAAPSCEGGPAPVLTRGRVGVSGLTIDGTGVYFIDSDRQTVNRCPVSGCGEAPEVMADAQRLPKNLVVTRTDVYWVGSPSSILRLAK